jgi:hypothetical protein
VILLISSLSPIYPFLLLWSLSTFLFGGLEISSFLLLYENIVHILLAKHKARHGKVR